MKPTTYIDWDNLQNIPFFLCTVEEDVENEDIDVYYNGELVLHDYNHCGYYLYTAIRLFARIKRITLEWVNLKNLWILRNCIRENHNHCIGVEHLIYGSHFDGKNYDTITPLTQRRFDYLCKRIRKLDPYATL